MNENRDIDAHQTRWRRLVDRLTEFRSTPVALLPLLAITLLCITSCATTSSHQFSSPTPDWTTKIGQLRYRAPGTTLIGEALVRFSNSGEFELTVSKGPGIPLLSLRQDATFAEVKGGLAGRGWSGPLGQAPAQLHAWIGLRDQFLRAPDRKNLHYTAGNETFAFRF
jgi:hypothetical protein